MSFRPTAWDEQTESKMMNIFRRQRQDQREVYSLERQQRGVKTKHKTIHRHIHAKTEKQEIEVSSVAYVSLA